MTGSSSDTWNVTVDPNNPGFLLIRSATGSMPDMLIPITAGGIKLVNTGGAIVFSGVLDAPGMDLEVIGTSIVVSPGSTIDLLSGSGFARCGTDKQNGTLSFRTLDSRTGAMATDASIRVNGSTIIGSSVKFAAFGSANEADAVGGKSSKAGAVAQSARAGATASRGASGATPPTPDDPAAPGTPSQPAPLQPLTSEAVLMTAAAHWTGGHDSSGQADLSDSIVCAAPGSAIVSETTSSGVTAELGSASARGPPATSTLTMTFSPSSLLDHATTRVDSSRRTSSLIEGSSEPINLIAAQADSAFASDRDFTLNCANTVHPSTCLHAVHARLTAPLTAALVRDPAAAYAAFKTTCSTSGKSSGESDVFAPTVAAAISVATVGAARISAAGVQSSGGSDVVASATTAALSAVAAEATWSLDLIGNDSGGSDVFAPAVAAAFCALWPGWHGY